MSKITRIVKYNEVDGGLYITSLSSRHTAEEVQRAGRGISDALAKWLAGKYILAQRVFAQDGTYRYRVYPPMLPKTLRADALRSTLSPSVFSFYGRDSVCFASKNGEGLFAFCCRCGFIVSVDRIAQHVATHRPNAVTCNECGAVVRSRHEREEHICRACRTKRNATRYGYHYRPNNSNPIFSAPNRRETDLHIGAEIEIDGSRDMAHSEFCTEANNANKNPFAPKWEFESDGSIHDGVEVISAPKTWRDWVTNRDEVEAIYLAAAHNRGAFNEYNGLHFHIDRAYFPNPEKSGVQIKYYVNKYYNLFMFLSFRPFGAVTRYGYTARDAVCSDLFAAVKHSPSHSSCFNNYAGNNTYELRTFGGKVNTASRFFVALDIVYALAKWARTTDFGASEKASVTALVRYLHNPRAVAEELGAWKADSASLYNHTNDDTKRQIDAFLTACAARAEKKGA